MASWCSSGARTEPAFTSESGDAPSTSSGLPSAARSTAASSPRWALSSAAAPVTKRRVGSSRGVSERTRRCGAVERDAARFLAVSASATGGPDNRAGQRPQRGLRSGRCPSLLSLLRTIPRSQSSRAPSPEEEDDHSAAQSPDRRCCKIHKFRVPPRREVLQVFKYPGVDPKAPNDPNGAPVQPVPRHCDCAGPGIGREMLKRAGKAGSDHVLRRQHGQKTEEADANPGQEPKRCSEKAGAHPRRLSELGDWQVRSRKPRARLLVAPPLRFPSGQARPSSERPSRVGGQAGGVARVPSAGSRPSRIARGEVPGGNPRFPARSARDGPPIGRAVTFLVGRPTLDSSRTQARRGGFGVGRSTLPEWDVSSSKFSIG